MKSLFALLFLFSILFFSCTHNSTVSLVSSTGNYYLKEIIGNWYMQDDKGIDKNAIWNISKYGTDFILNIYKLENGNWKKREGEKGIILSATTIDNTNFLETKQEGEYDQFKYNIIGDYFYVNPINSTFKGNKIFNSTTEYRNYVSNNIDNYKLFDKTLTFVKATNAEIKQNYNENAAAALLLLLGGLMLSGDNNQNSKSDNCNCSQCGGTGRIYRLFDDLASTLCPSCDGSGKCKN